MASVFDKNGNEVFVPEDEVDSWLKKGYLDHKLKIEHPPQVQLKRAARRKAIMEAKEKGLSPNTPDGRLYVSERTLEIMAGVNRE